MATKPPDASQAGARLIGTSSEEPHGDGWERTGGPAPLLSARSLRRRTAPWHRRSPHPSGALRSSSSSS